MTEPVSRNLATDDVLAGRASALAESTHDDFGRDGDQFEREDRAALRRLEGLSTELTDVTEVEYRQLRLERVVLASVWTEGTVTDAENSLRELSCSRWR